MMMTAKGYIHGMQPMAGEKMMKKMNYQRRCNVQKIIIGMLCTLIFGCVISGCRTTVPRVGEPATEYRAVAGEIGAGQAELGITGARIEERSASLEQAISGGAGTIQEIRRIIQQVRNQTIGRNDENKP